MNEDVRVHGGMRLSILSVSIFFVYSACRLCTAKPEWSGEGRTQGSDVDGGLAGYDLGRQWAQLRPVYVFQIRLFRVTCSTEKRVNNDNEWHRIY
jgi:hypothetical protein